MERIKIGNGHTVERYIDDNGKSYVRIKYNDKHRMEVIMQEYEFEKVYGKFN